MTRRIALLKAELRKRKLDALLITKDVNVSYETLFQGHDAVAIVTEGRSYLIADSRYIEEARNSVKGFEILLVKSSLYEVIGDIVRERKLARLGFESTNLPYEVVIRLKEFTAKCSLVPVKGSVEELRAIKEPGEIKLIRESIRMTKDVLEETLTLMKPGASEESLARKIEVAFLLRGAKAGFDPIVAIDENASKPHAKATSRKISKNSVIMVDMGCSLNSYNSDMTRMIFVGNIKPRIKKIYDVVRTAKAMAIEAIRPGVKIAKIDSIARRYILDKGFGKYFGHALGHGVGMDVHEKPTVSGISEGILAPGMVFTVEPAIYIPKVGGVRIEDMVLVTDKGCEVLSR